MSTQTKLIWTGKKKHCKNKLITKGLQFGCTQFDLLELTFSVDLDSMLDLNLSGKLTEIKISSKYGTEDISPNRKSDCNKDLFFWPN